MSPTLREKTAIVRRRHVLDAAIRVFAARGYHGATIRDISSEAGVSDGAIYTLFENKAALLLGMLDPLDERGAPEPLRPIDADLDVQGFVRELFRQRWQTLTPETLDVLRVVLSEALVDPSLREILMARVLTPALTLPEAQFSRFVAEGRLRPVDIPTLLRGVTGVFLGLVMLRLLGDPQTCQHWDDVPEQMSALLLGGLVPDGAGGETHDQD